MAFSRLCSSKYKYVRILIAMSTESMLVKFLNYFDKQQIANPKGLWEQISRPINFIWLT